MISRYLVIFTLLILSSQCFEQLHGQYELMAYFEKNSLKPVLHTYYNRHFKNSTRFRQFEQTLQELYANHGDYLEILLTDCDQDVEKKINTCQQMARTKDNRQVTGTVPSSKFRKLGDKLIQNPPTTQVFGHKSDVYSYDQLRKFMLQLLPNFYQEVNNLQEYEDYLLPHYSPKLLVFIRDDEEIPSVLKEIAIHFFLKIDFIFVTDLTEDIVSLFSVKKYPSFVIIKYNFNEGKHEHYYYTESDFNEQNYQQIKSFVEKYALQEPRNDLLFHKINMETDSEIVTLETPGELEQFKERASGWVIIANSDGKIPQKLTDFHNRFGRFFSYVNYVHEPVNKIQLFNPTENFTFPLGNELEFNKLNFQDFKSNMTIWLSKNMLILGATEDYAHICGLAEKTLFRGHVRCLIISKQGEEELQKFMKIDFKIGFLVRTQGAKQYQDGNRETTGLKFVTDEYNTIYRELDYATRMHLKQELDEYLRTPVSQVRHQDTLYQTCFHPFKKCLLLVTNLGKQDRTFQQYLKELAFDYMNSFTLYEVDIESNPELLKAIGGIKDKKADLISYNPRTQQYTRLNRKVTKNLIAQFLKANLKDDKRLKKENGEVLGKVFIKRRKTQTSKKQENEEL